MGYLLILLRTLMYSGGNAMRKNYARATMDVPSSTDVYMLIAHLFASVFLFILAKASVPLDMPTLFYAAVYATICGISAFISTQSYKMVNFFYISIFSGAGSLLIPFFYEVLIGQIASVGKILAVVLRILAILVPLIFQREKIKGLPLCLALFVTGGISVVFMKLFSVSSAADNSSSVFFWTNVFVLPAVVVRILKKYKLSGLVADMKKIKPQYYLCIMAPTAINNVASLLTVVILQMVSATISTVLSSCCSIVLTAFLSVVIYKEKMTLQGKISMVLTMFSAIIGVF